jgi:hypothetical protein
MPNEVRFFDRDEYGEKQRKTPSFPRKRESRNVPSGAKRRKSSSLLREAWLAALCAGGNRSPDGATLAHRPARGRHFTT